MDRESNRETPPRNNAASCTGISPEGAACSAQSRPGSFLVSPLASLNSPEGNENAITLVLRQAEALVNEWSGR